MMRNLIIIFAALFLLTFCCKEEEPKIEFPSLVGHWDIIQIDSCVRYVYPYNDPPELRSSFLEKGTIVFNEDSTGFFLDPIRSLTCGETNFNWRHNRIYGQIDLTFPNGKTNCRLKTFKKDTVEFYLKAYCNSSPIGVVFYYYLKLGQID